MSCEIEIKTTSYPGPVPVTKIRKMTIEELTGAHLSRYYTLVYQHVRDDCIKCRPNPVLEAYLKKRLERPKFGGRTSAGLCDLAAKMGRIGAKRELVNRFFVLCGQPRKVLERDELSSDEFLEGAFILWKDMRRNRPRAHSNLEVALARFVPSSRKRALLHIGRLIDEEAPMPGSPKELRDLLAVSEVMLS